MLNIDEYDYIDVIDHDICHFNLMSSFRDLLCFCVIFIPYMHYTKMRPSSFSISLDFE
jgi:hypothetical protein